MSVLNVALIGSEDLARRMGKRGDVRDVESYVYKEGSGEEARVLSFLRPLKHPEKLRPLLSVLDVARAGLIEIKQIDSTLGESLVALGCSRIEHGHVVITNDQGSWVDPSQVEVLLKQAGLEGWKIHEGDLDEHSLRDELFEFQKISSIEIDNSDSPLILPVDQHFNVKGVGLVAIGYVQSGSVSKHDEVEVFPAGEVGIVRSLQVMDDDVDLAVAGDRVGVALRNLRESSLHRGCMICEPGKSALVRNGSSTIRVKMAPFQKRVFSEGDVIHAASDLQFVVGRVTHVGEESISVDWDSPLWIRSDGSSEVVLVQLDAMPMRIMGSAREITPVS